MLTFLEKFLKNQDDLNEIENKLSDYDNLISLQDIIKNIFSHLQFKIDEYIERLKSEQGNSEEYE